MLSTLRKTAAAPKNEINFNALLSAIKDNLLNEKAIRAASREHGVDRMTLARHVKKVADYFTDISNVSDVDLLTFIKASNTHNPSNMVCFLSTMIVFKLKYFLPTLVTIFLLKDSNFI